MNRTTFLAATLAATALPASGRAAAMPEAMLRRARLLVDEVTPANNFYGSHPTYVEWSDDGGTARNRSVCSSLVNHLLERTFGYTPADIDAWFRKRVPQAIDYHETVAARRGFTLVRHVDKIRPGDLFAIGYPAGSKPTGHVMIADSTARAVPATAPIVAGTRQFLIDVIDSANSGHGVRDTRRRTDRTWTTGVGRGTLRLYVLEDDTLAGYSWSASHRSLFRPMSERRVAIGRLDAARVPKPSGAPGPTASGTAAGAAEDDGAAADDGTSE